MSASTLPEDDARRKEVQAEIGETYYAYGHLREAVPHLRAVVRASCRLSTSPVWENELFERLLKTCLALGDEACARGVAMDAGHTQCDANVTMSAVRSSP